MIITMHHYFKIVTAFGILLSSICFLVYILNEGASEYFRGYSLNHEDLYRIRTNDTLRLVRTNENNKSSCRKIPDILIIGFEKCGTVTLKKFLGIHPKIFITQSRINNRFFNPDNKKTFADFTKDMPCTPTGKLRLEKIATPGLPKLVYELNPDVKLIVIVKEPVERALSHFVHLKLNDKLQDSSVRFENVVRNYLEHYLEKETFSPLFRFSLYANRIQPWIEIFGRERIQILDGDYFVKDPVTELKKAEIFLGLNTSITREDFYYSEEKGFYCIKSLGDRGCMGRRKGRPHPAMPNGTRKMLQRFFKPKNEKFFSLIGRRFQWNY